MRAAFRVCIAALSFRRIPDLLPAIIVTGFNAAGTAFRILASSERRVSALLNPTAAVSTILLVGAWLGSEREAFVVVCLN